jgi:hypothetical protein
MPKFTFDNVTVQGDTATKRYAIKQWLRSKALELGPFEEGQPTPTREEIRAYLMKELRRVRNEVLRDSDWTQLPDAPVSISPWQTYRQALRDLPQTITEPEDIETSWPDEPGA